jgi:ribosomal protein L21E
MATDTRLKDANWNVYPTGQREGGIETYPPQMASLAVLMDLRDAMKDLIVEIQGLRKDLKAKKLVSRPEHLKSVG